MANPTDKLAAGISGVLNAVSGFASSLGSVTGPLSALAGAAEKVGGMVGGSLGGALEGFGAVAGAAAAGMEQLISVMKGYAGAAAPAVIFEFNRALRDLSATVGTAFVSFFDAMIGITRQVAGALYPAMQRLTPAFTALAQLVGAVVLPIADLVADILSTLAPILRLLVDVLTGTQIIFNALLLPLRLMQEVMGEVLSALDPFLELIEAMNTELGAVLEAVTAVFKAAIATVFDFIKALFAGFSLKGVMDGLRSATQKVIEGLAVFAVKLANLFGATGFADNLIKALSPQPFAASQPAGAGITGIEQIAKTLESASAVAVGASGAADKGFNLGDVVKAIQDAQAAGNDWRTALKGWIDDAAKVIAAAVRKELPHPYDAARDGLGNLFKRTLGHTTAGLLGDKNAGL
jgi:phage-related protein